MRLLSPNMRLLSPNMRLLSPKMRLLSPNMSLAGLCEHHDLLLFNNPSISPSHLCVWSFSLVTNPTVWPVPLCVHGFFPCDQNHCLAAPSLCVRPVVVINPTVRPVSLCVHDLLLRPTLLFHLPVCMFGRFSCNQTHCLAAPSLCVRPLVVINPTVWHVPLCVYGLLLRPTPSFSLLTQVHSSTLSDIAALNAQRATEYIYTHTNPNSHTYPEHRKRFSHTNISGHT